MTRQASSPMEQLNKLLEELGTQKAVAEKLGFSEQYIGEIFRGTRDISEPLAQKLGFKKVIDWERIVN